MEGDQPVGHTVTLNKDFNPHLPCGRWPIYIILVYFSYTFQSTPSVWKVTRQINKESDVHSHFNPHLPCGRWQSGSFKLFERILFQSTPSVWKVTIREKRTGETQCNFNPHLPCGRWQGYAPTLVGCYYFNPHLPCGRWLSLVLRLADCRLFQSTPSVWKVTGDDVNYLNVAIISIHTFRVEGDATLVYIQQISQTFQSTPSVWKVT